MLKLSSTHLAILAALVLLRILSGPTANVSFILLAIYSLLGKPHAVRALFLSWFFTMLNPGIGPTQVSFASMGRYLVVVAAAISVFVLHGAEISHGDRSRVRFFYLSLGLGIFFFFHSIFFSYIEDVSILKSLVWAITFVTLLKAWVGLGSLDHQQLESQIFSMLIFLMILSIPLLLTNVGYLRNGAGFQGVLNHPQAFGVMMACIAAWVASQILIRTDGSIWFLLLFVTTLILIVLSGARTAGLAFGVGYSVSLTLGRFIAGVPFRLYLPGLNNSVVRWTIGSCLAVSLLLAPNFSPLIEGYISKGTSSANISDAFEQSRGFLLVRMFENIAEHPLAGIGFGISSDPHSMVVERDSVLGLPSGAPVEKGIVFVAVWEEVGFFGFLMFVGWLVMLIFRSAAHGGLAALSVSLTVLMTNFGESTLFSAGGMGMLLLILLAWASSGKTSDQQGDRYD